MRFTYVEDTRPTRKPARAPRSRAYHLLTVVLFAVAGLAAYELISFAIDYIQALRG